MMQYKIKNRIKSLLYFLNQLINYLVRSELKKHSDKKIVIIDKKERDEDLKIFKNLFMKIKLDLFLKPQKKTFTKLAIFGFELTILICTNEKDKLV